MADESRDRSNQYTLFLSVCCLALAVLVLMLIWENRSLKQQLTVAATPAEHSSPPSLADDFYRDISLVGEEGSVVPEYTGDGSWTLLLFFSEACGACEEVLPLWSDLVSSLPASDLHVYGVRLEEDLTGDAWASEAEFPFEIYRLDLASTGSVTGLALPSTVLMDDTGNVAKVWRGVPPDGRFDGLRGMVERR